MVETHEHFLKRLTTLGRKHQRMQSGYVTQVGRDGLISVKPKRASGGLPIKGLLLMVIGFFAFKAFVLAGIGPVTYNDRVAKLEAGTMLEQVGAKALTIDPVTAALADFAGPVLR